MIKYIFVGIVILLMVQYFAVLGGIFFAALFGETITKKDIKTYFTPYFIYYKVVIEIITWYKNLKDE